ncbi:putative receptor protein kinase ZmPK1 [Camellia lanceoleosa]|uniref:Receptor protein kinase ZmPK1 n=1 Tax=Camellia lanceoleosa TaxID=1840588 RepID=A0ACC0HTK4_9ERIC|nr:putative receptor protein kinase ZmPK1 [Camellia lanceoleosa]
MGHDGNIRLYSLEERSKTWTVSWQALLEPCRIHGICGPNSLCTYVPHEKSGRRCSCLPGYKIKNDSDWSLGCEPDFSPPCNDRSGELQRLGVFSKGVVALGSSWPVWVVGVWVLQQLWGPEGSLQGVLWGSLQRA